MRYLFITALILFTPARVLLAAPFHVTARSEARIEYGGPGDSEVVGYAGLAVTR
jgi:hypothetical protein